MSLKARVYVGFVISIGAIALGYGLYPWEGPNLLRFLCYLALAIPASCLKVTLPGIRLGTMSVLFIFLLGGIVQLNLPETLVIGTVCVAAQSLWHSRFGARLVQVAFSVATIALAITATNFTYHAVPFLLGPFRLVMAVSVFFLVNTFPIAVVIALTEGKSLRHVWSSCYLWCFPYYLVGAGIVSAFSFYNRMSDWQAGILILPVVYVVYRSYQLYLNQLQGERQRAEEEHKHADEIAALHAQTVEALNSAMTANARLDAVFRASPLAFLTLDREGKVTGWNAMAEHIFGWSAEEIAGQPLPFATGRSEEIIQGIIGRTLHGELISGLEMQQWRKDGSPFDAAIWTAMLQDSEGVPGMLVTVADVSTSKRLEEQLRLSQKMEAVGRLAGGVAHDFNNLLTVINGYGSMLLNTVSGHPYAVSQAEEILSAGTRAAELVSQLLTFSRRQMIRPRPLETNQLVRGVERMLKRVLGEHIELRTNLSPDSGWIHADLNQMEAVLLNLATNARDAMGGGGVLTIETSRVEIVPSRPLPNADLTPGSYVCMIVRDTGRGMDNETKQRLFEPFYTTKEWGKGTGLGLSSVHGGVEQNLGRISVWSELGKGSEFSIYLPRIESPDSPEPTAPAASRKLAEGTETILLVEDESAVRRMLREALSKAGYRVREAGNGSEAIELWAREIESIDLVVTDVVMPVMNGLKLIEELRKMRPGIRVVCMSGHSEDVISGQSGPDAPLDLLRKPFLPDALVRKVREILDQPSKWPPMLPTAARLGAQWRG
jgi:two-component system cell cycle sensor histidine kinase/response regulator CckA